MTAWLVPAGGRTALNLAGVRSISIDDAKTPNGMAGRVIVASLDNGSVVPLTSPKEQGAKDGSRPRVGWFDGPTGAVFDLLLSAVADAAAGDRPLIRLDDLEALARDRR